MATPECGIAHDPEPWVSYTMMTGSAGGWRGSEKFAPRKEYCQSLECYEAHRLKKKREEEATAAWEAQRES